MERIILNQEHHSVKEIYQDFYMFLAEHFTPLGYKYRKSKHDMYKNIENFRVVFDYQTFSWNCLGNEIGVFIYKKYEYVESGLEEKYTTCLDKSAVVKTVDWEGLNKHSWYDYYIEASVKKVYNSFCKYFKEEYEKK